MVSLLPKGQQFNSSSFPHSIQYASKESHFFCCGLLLFYFPYLKSEFDFVVCKQTNKQKILTGRKIQK